jgi:hypothetical protein
VAISDLELIQKRIGIMLLTVTTDKSVTGDELEPDEAKHVRNKLRGAP